MVRLERLIEKKTVTIVQFELDFNKEQPSNGILVARIGDYSNGKEDKYIRDSYRGFVGFSSASKYRHIFSQFLLDVDAEPLPPFGLAIAWEDL